MNPLRLSLVLPALALVLLPLSGQSPQPGGRGDGGGLPGLPPAVREALLLGDTAAALQAIDQGAKELPSIADSFAYLKAVALDHADRRAEALQALDALEASARGAGTAAWRDKARFLRAELLRRERRFEEAAAIYADEARRLSGPARQGELAEIYLRYAEELAAESGKPAGAKPEFARAAALFARAASLAAPDAVRERAAWRRAQCLESAEIWAEASAALREYLAEFDPAWRAAAAPDAASAAEPASNAVGSPAWIFQARLALARALSKLGRPLEARRVLEDLSTDLRRAAGGEGPLGAAVRKLSGDGLRAVLDLDGEAQYAVAGTWFQQGGGSATNTGRQGVSSLRRFVERFPAHARAAKARLELGEALAAAGESDAAIAAFDAILALPKPAPSRAGTGPATGAGPDAARQREAATIAAHALFLKGSELSRAGRHAEARDAFVLYTREHPAGADWTEAQRRMLESEYAIGAAQREREEFDAAKQSFVDYLARHPLDPRAEVILFDIGALDAAVARAEKTPEAERPTRWRAAVATWRELEAKYAESDPAAAGEARMAIGRVLEEELGDFEGAIAAYRACANTPSAGDAQAALRAMSEPSLALSVERAALGAEKLTAKLDVRNVEKVSVELWRLDLEAYFEKNLGHGDVEGLDLDLIDAQQKFEFQIPGYARHRPIECPLELDTHGVSGPGAWVIAVTAGKLRASALCLRSDIDLIVKSTPAETLVFAQDVARGTPAAGVRVLVALGERQGSAAPVIQEAVTDAQGAARFALEPRATSGHVSVLGVRDGHWASCGVDFDVDAPASVLARALAFTDRPAYRPGETVHWRAIVRGVEDGRLAVQPGRKLEWRVQDARGRTLASSAPTTSEFGTASGEFVLPESSPLGVYTLFVAAPDAGAGGVASTSANFTVAEFELVHVALDVAFEHATYFRGETAAATIEARYSHGGPVADAPLAIHLPDGRTTSARTDADGRARVEFDTREFAEEALLELEATLSEVPLTETARAYLALREYSLSLSAVRSEVPTGAPFTVQVIAAGPRRDEQDAGRGADAGRKLSLEIARLVERPGRPAGETVLRRMELVTDDAGEARPVLTLDQGGEYRLRVLGTDRFANRIVADLELTVVGADERDSLTLFSDSYRLVAGAQAAAEVHESGPGGLALMTLEAGRVLEWRWIQLEPGKNALAFPVGEDFAPGFVLGVAHQRRGTFRDAELEFYVERELSLAVRPAAESLAPGAEAAIEVEVRDALGRPVAAEVSLAVVDEALYRLYADATPDLAAFFRSPPFARRPAVSVGSSADFSYEGSTWEVSGEVLAEEQRVEEERLWKDQRAEAAKLLAGHPAPGAPATGAPAAKEKAGEDEFTLGEGGGGGGKYGARRGGRVIRGQGAGTDKKDKAALPDPLSIASPTAFWTADLATDAGGKARASFTAPSTSTSWRVVARVAAKDPRAASATASFRTRADFFVELATPAALCEGDRPRFFARLHNTTSAPMEVETELVLRGAGLSTTLPGEKLVVPPGAREIVFPELPSALAVGTLELALSARATSGGKRLEARDAARLTARPFGVEYSVAKSGELTSAADFTLELPAGRRYENLSLELFVGATLDALLVDEALGRFPMPCLRAPGADGLGRAADLFGASEVLLQLARTGRDSSTDHARVRARVVELALAVIASQDDRRGWASPVVGAEQAVESSALCMLALANARDAGIPVAPEVSEAGVAALEELQRSTSNEERRALIQHALARWGRGDWGVLNRLHRLRAELSNAALVHASLALSALERRELAAEVAAVLETRAVFDPKAPELGASWPVDKNLPWSRSTLQTAAFAVLALEAAAPRSETLARGVQHLLSHRPWFDPRARGVALCALARHAGTTRPDSERFEVTAAVGDAAPVKLDPARGSLSIPLDGRAPGEARTPGETRALGKVRVRLALTGRGAPQFAAVLRGFSAEVPDRRAAGARLEPLAVAAPAPTWRGRAVNVGFSTVRNPRESWQNRITGLARGASALASVSLDRRTNVIDGDALEWLVVEVPLPAGTRVRPGSVQGALVNSEILADRLIVTVPPGYPGAWIQFTLDGVVPGRYRVAPAVARATSGELVALGEAREFEVLPLGASSTDPYRATPDELHDLGLAAWRDGDADRARAFLTQLMQAFQAELGDENSSAPLQQAASALFFLALDRGDAPEIVRWFELLREKRPDLVIPFDRILAVANAYSTIDEHERALSILRASVEETFGVDLKVAGGLESAGDLSGALTLLSRLWREYPDAPSVLQAWLALSDKLLTAAPQAASEPSFVRDGRSRSALHLEGTRLLQWFLCLYPRDPQAGEAALNLVSAHLGLEDYAAASALATAFAARFPAPEFADAFLYSRAVAEWYQGHDDQALSTCERVAQATFVDAKGVERPSKNRELAQYILAQIHHARREVARAAEYYAKVETSFADARAALAGLREKRLSLAEVTRAKPGDTVRLALRSKNVPSVELSIYPVDLMTLYLREADLSQISKVELAGIAPELTQSAALGAQNALREHEDLLELALPRTGAYLAIARGGELFASGLILVSDLELDVDEDVESGLVRVQVVDGRDGKYVRDVDVRVVGSADKQIQRARTDPRGLASVDSVHGQATVIARGADNRYAFHRGTLELGPKKPGEGRKSRDRVDAAEQLSQGAYLKNVYGFNEQNQSSRAGQLDAAIQRERPGVSLQQVK